MKSNITHIQVNIDPKNTDFYKNLMNTLGISLLMEGEGFAGYEGSNGVSIWFVSAIINEEGNYDQKGFNHLGFSADSISEVDEMVEWLKQHNISPLFDTPRHRPEFAKNEEETYYQVMFESPDKVLFEIVYIGKK